jgi:hypothetical protein
MDPLRMLNPKTVAEAMEAGWKDLAVRCNACGHEAHVSWASVTRIGRLDRIPGKLKCKACGAKQPTCWPWMDPVELKRLQRLVRS